MKIVATYDPKPVPLRHWDWTAIDADTCDGAPDSPNHYQVGYGATRLEAINDLAEMLKEDLL